MGHQNTTPAMGSMLRGLDVGPTLFARLSGLPGIDGLENILGAPMQFGWDGGAFAGGGAGGFNPFPGGFPPRGGGGDGGVVVASFDEDITGDLSGDGAVPTDIGTLALGTTVIRATQQGDPRDMDYITFTVPEGTELSGLTVLAYDAAPGNLAFIGIEGGAVFVTAPGTTDASTLLGGLVYAQYAVSLDILGLMGSLEGAQGFEEPLGPGEYTLWLNQTGPASTVTLGLDLTAAGDGRGGASAGVLNDAVLV